MWSYMTDNMDFHLANSLQISQALGARLASIRLSRNLTQAQVAAEAGVSLRTLRRLEDGDGVTLDGFVRVMMALRLQDHLAALLPDPGVRPIERATRQGRLRQRARAKKASVPASEWAWGSEPDA